VEQHTHPTRLLRVCAVPLALLAQRAASTVADASRIHETETAIAFSVLFRCPERLPSRATQRTISLKHKVSPTEAASFEGQGHLGCGIATGRSSAIRRRQESLSKLGSAHRLRHKLMPQFQAQGRDPLADHLPQFLSSSRVTAPAVGVLFQIFIGESIFKGPTMQVKGHHIGRGESWLRQVGQEEFIDDAVSFDADLTLRLPCWMGCHHLWWLLETSVREIATLTSLLVEEEVMRVKSEGITPLSLTCNSLIFMKEKSILCLVFSPPTGNWSSSACTYSNDAS
jgi:hypothetical protein